MKQFKKVYIIRDNSITNEPCNYYFEGSEDLNPTKEVIHGTSFHQAPSVFLHWMKKLEHTQYACGVIVETRSVKPDEALSRLREGDTISVPNRFVLHLPFEHTWQDKQSSSVLQSGSSTHICKIGSHTKPGQQTHLLPEQQFLPSSLSAQ